MPLTVCRRRPGAASRTARRRRHHAVRERVDGSRPGRAVRGAVAAFDRRPGPRCGRHLPEGDRGRDQRAAGAVLTCRVGQANRGSGGPSVAAPYLSLSGLRRPTMIRAPCPTLRPRVVIRWSPGFSRKFRSIPPTMSTWCPGGTPAPRRNGLQIDPETLPQLFLLAGLDRFELLEVIVGREQAERSRESKVVRSCWTSALKRLISRRSVAFSVFFSRRRRSGRARRRDELDDASSRSRRVLPSFNRSSTNPDRASANAF